MTRILLMFLVLGFAAGSSSLSPEVELPLGAVRGYFANSASGRQYAAFEGIPYAKPPVGKNRFRESQPVKPWVGTWPANTIHKCIQYYHFAEPGQDKVLGSEDCLYVNIYTTNVNQDKQLDVIVYIHGGAFMFLWGGAYGPEHILDRDVVYVTFNYRLGPLGFLSTEDHVVPGNNGLKDQLLALKWIKQNIVFFGGNPNSITITGMSAGGASVHLHSLSPLSTGLFRGGISQSGTALNPWVIVENSLHKAQQVAQHVGCPTMTTKEMIDCLRFRSAYQIVAAVKLFQPWLYNPFSPFGVVVDKWSEQPFLPEHPYQILKNGKVQDLSLGYFHIQKLKGCIQVQALSDRLFIVDCERAGKLHAASIKSPVYYYYFSYRGAHSASEIRANTNKNFGAAHADDTLYVLQSLAVEMHTTENDRQMADVLKNMWISFANTGVPKLPSVLWPPMSKDIASEVSYVHIESPSKITISSTDTFGNRKFWDSLPLQENKILFTIKDEL